MKLVIGGCGFVGSNLIKKLDGEIVVLDNNFTGHKKIKGVKYIKGDSSNIDKLIKKVPEIIYHFGEYPRVIPSFDDIETVVEYNGIGTLRVLEYCRKHKVRLVYAGSSTKFGDAESPYSFLKRQNTELIKRYGKWFGLDYVITYFYNVYGEGEIRTGKYATLIGRLSENIKTGKPHTIYKPGTQRRAFTHISDIINGLILVGEKGYGEYCIGNPKEYSIKEVAKIFGGKIQYAESKKGDRTMSKINLKRIKKLGWKPRVNLKEWIKKQSNPLLSGHL